MLTVKTRYVAKLHVAEYFSAHLTAFADIELKEFYEIAIFDQIFRARYHLVRDVNAGHFENIFRHQRQHKVSKHVARPAANVKQAVRSIVAPCKKVGKLVYGAIRIEPLRLIEIRVQLAVVHFSDNTD